MRPSRSGLTGNLSLYQIQTRVALSELGQKLGRKATLDDIPDQDLDHLAERGFDWIWYLGIWQTGVAGRNVSESHSEWQAGYWEILPDLQPSDISGSPFAITAYVVHSDFGGRPALERLRERLHQRGMRLMLDFVANHTAPDHPWVQAHPEFYVPGDEEKLGHEPHNYVRIEMRGSQILAYGRDPYFSGWPDTLQLNYAEPPLQAAMREELLGVASQCDGVRCDMAMLLLPEVFERTWELRAESFWPEAIGTVRREHPEFLFMAEVYWGLEWTLQQQGFDYTYDKKLYDLLRSGHARPVRDHFSADLSFQRKSARFLENHDEPRAAAVFSWEMHQPAAVLTYLCPGLRFFHDGQLEGRSKRLSVHLGRGPTEQAQPLVKEFYDRLLRCVQQPLARDGQWRMLSCSAASEGDWTWECFVCFLWEATSELPLLVAVNYADHQSQCYAQLPTQALWGQIVRGRDLLSPAVYEGKCDESGRLFLGLQAWGYRVLALAAG
ncbi:MAG: alpha-amylase family glycosyl hydrolase [Acidobacteriaceae bacterium]